MPRALTTEGASSRLTLPTLAFFSPACEEWPLPVGSPSGKKLYGTSIAIKPGPTHVCRHAARQARWSGGERDPGLLYDRPRQEERRGTGAGVSKASPSTAASAVGCEKLISETGYTTARRAPMRVVSSSAALVETNAGYGGLNAFAKTGQRGRQKKGKVGESSRPGSQQRGGNKPPSRTKTEDDGTL